MTLHLTKRHRESLEALRYECYYEDHRHGDQLSFIRWEQLTRSHGVKTRADLVEAGYAIGGQHRWNGKIGYRITQSGRAALEAKPPAQPEASRTKIRRLEELPLARRIEGQPPRR